MWTRSLAQADATCGGKAHGLARLIGAGLRVPDGFVIDDRAFRVATGDAVRQVTETGQRSPVTITELHRAARSGPIDPRAIEEAAVEVGAVLEPDPGISMELRRAGPDRVGHALAELAHRISSAELPEDLIAEVTTRARRLGGPFVVRSSATIEDGEVGAAAGVFSSHGAVSLDDVWPAIRMVWLSALTPLAAAYARHRGGEIAISVIVQRYLAGELVTVYTRPPGRPDGGELVLQRDGELARIARDANAADTSDVGVLAARCLDAEAAIAASHGADVELIVPPADTAGDRAELGGAHDPAQLARGVSHAWMVQARPIVHPVVKPRTAPPPLVVATLDDGRRWTLDLAHNPDPMSVAQAGLVERVERAGAAPWASRVCAGYLYTTPHARHEVVRPASVDELRARAEQIEQRLERVLDLRGAPSGHDLAAVIERYLAFYRIWAHELGPLIAASRGSVPAPLGTRTDAAESWLVAAAKGVIPEESVVDLLGVLSPAWDVASPTFGERPYLVRTAIARVRAAISTTSERQTELVEPPDPTTATIEYFAFRRTLAGMRNHEGACLEELAADLAERDDFYFAVAQWTVRRAILQRADELGIAREDACWVPLDELIAGELDLVDAARRASGARAAAERASMWSMPIVVGDSSTRNSGVALRGVGSGDVVSGRVRRFESLASARVVGHGDIVVTRAVTPALAVIVIGCAAIISETGGLLDHGAAMARELGIPCIVGCRDAWAQLADGMIVTIDHDAVTISQ